jgi:methoxymalonate biosynthesis acyl carrier protein
VTHATIHFEGADMSEDTAAPIREFITGRYPQVRFSDSDDIFSLGFINSLFAMELVMFIEKHFALSLPNPALQIANFRTVDAMAALVETYRIPVAQG